MQHVQCHMRHAHAVGERRAVEDTYGLRTPHGDGFDMALETDFETGCKVKVACDSQARLTPVPLYYLIYSLSGVAFMVLIYPRRTAVHHPGWLPVVC